MKKIILLSVILILTSAAFGGSDDIIIADFEGSDFGNWDMMYAGFGYGPLSAAKAKDRGKAKAEAGFVKIRYRRSLD